MGFNYSHLRAPRRAVDQHHTFDSLQSFSLNELSAPSQIWTDESDYVARSRHHSSAMMVQNCPAIIQQTLTYKQSVHQLGIFANDIGNDISYENPFYYGCSPLQSPLDTIDTENLSMPEDLVRLSAPVMSCNDIVFDEGHSPAVSSLRSSVDMFTVYSSSYERAEQRPEIRSQLCISPDEIQTAVPEEDISLRLRERTSAARTATLGKQEYTPVQKESKKQIKKRQARQAHSLVERRYRDNLNLKFQALHHTLQKANIVKATTEVLCSDSSNSSQDNESKQGDIDDVDQASSRLKKSDILIKAIDYIQATKLEERRRDLKIQQLISRIQTMETSLLNY